MYKTPLTHGEQKVWLVAKMPVEVVGHGGSGGAGSVRDCGWLGLARVPCNLSTTYACCGYRCNRAVARADLEFCHTVWMNNACSGVLPDFRTT